MLETKEEVAEIVRAAMRQLNLEERGHIEFHPLLPDSVGKADGTYGPVVWEYPPHWSISFTYPVGEDNATTREFNINTAEFQNLGEIERFIIEQIQN